MDYLLHDKATKRLGDSPPHAALTDTEDAYEPTEGDAASISQLGDKSNLSVNHLDMAGSPSPAPSNETDTGAASMFISSRYKSPAAVENTAAELNELFQYVHRYKPLEVELEPTLKPFIPDYIPAVGDLDASIRIPRPDLKPDTLGQTILDEPSAQQSDPTVLGIQLRAYSKAPSINPYQIVNSIDAETLKSNPKQLNNWIENIKDLHIDKPPASVQYSRRMPDLEDLMQVWPADFEELLKNTTLPTASLDMDLKSYINVVTSLLDIPLGTASKTNSSSASRRSSMKSKNNSYIESLHVLFSLYLEFKNSGHFKVNGNDEEWNNPMDGEENGMRLLETDGGDDRHENVLVL